MLLERNEKDSHVSSKFTFSTTFSRRQHKIFVGAVFQNSCRSQKVVDQKESLSTGKSCRQHLLLCVYNLTFVIIMVTKYGI